jgi:hypothetical protein
MADIPQLVVAIDNRLADIAAEISALVAAKAELAAAPAGGPSVRGHRGNSNPITASNGTPSSDAPTSASRAGHEW